MGRIFITGSADGLGLLAAKSLIEKGHQVVAHARDENRKLDITGKLKGADGIVTGNLSDIEETKELAQQLNSLGKFDAVIHNAGVYNAAPEQIFKVNTLAPYILTSLMQRPKRLIYLCSDMHTHADASIGFSRNGFDHVTYSDSKFYVLLLSLAVSRKWKDVYSNTVDPGWVPTKMGGRSAPGDLAKGYETQVWLAASNDEKAKVTGRYFYHQKERSYKKEANNFSLQDQFLDACNEISGIPFPA
ncbi:SDR family NAD(P)-dependent oxidoreductase [Chitinophaga sp. RCC_12]|uniref:SDR family NAD(P)-dependent oxidoreductase n=1 Tax=Chitinophaga sp. RCC_12 TaxID=3239226 RepID=UPI003526409A